MADEMNVTEHTCTRPQLRCEIMMIVAPPIWGFTAHVVPTSAGALPPEFITGTWVSPLFLIWLFLVFSFSCVVYMYAGPVSWVPN